jgi:hypothetical protein
MVVVAVVVAVAVAVAALVHLPLVLIPVEACPTNKTAVEAVTTAVAIAALGLPLILPVEA